jgi:hypothetical protein
MCNKSNALLLSLLMTVTFASYLEFQLIRMPHKVAALKLEPVSCKNESSINQDA